VGSVLERVGLSSRDAGKYPHQFSGGQRQRVVLARALMTGPRVLVLDEPLSNLDVSVQASILNLLRSLNQDLGTAFLFISHDLGVVSYLSRRLMVLYLGRVMESGSTQEVLKTPTHPYTRALLESSRTRRATLVGDPPNPAAPPEGCSFHTRCPFAEERCRQTEAATLRTVGEGRSCACWKWDRLLRERDVGGAPTGKPRCWRGKAARESPHRQPTHLVGHALCARGTLRTAPQFVSNTSWCPSPSPWWRRCWRRTGHEVKIIDCVAEEMGVDGLREAVKAFDPAMLLLNMSTATSMSDMRVVRPLGGRQRPT
jgi:oligopeptide/dipeptide ABC transporter ATP-binding protein